MRRYDDYRLSRCGEDEAATAADADDRASNGLIGLSAAASMFETLLATARRGSLARWA